MPGFTDSSSAPARITSAGSVAGPPGSGPRFDGPSLSTRSLDSPIAMNSSAPFSSFSVEHRAVLVLTHYVGLPAPEIAEILGIPPGTVYSRLHYAIRAMRAP